MRRLHCTPNTGKPGCKFNSHYMPGHNIAVHAPIYIPLYCKCASHGCHGWCHITMHGSTRKLQLWLFCRWKKMRNIASNRMKARQMQSRNRLNAYRGQRVHMLSKLWVHLQNSLSLVLSSRQILQMVVRFVSSFPASSRCSIASSPMNCGLLLWASVIPLADQVAVVDIEGPSHLPPSDLFSRNATDTQHLSVHCSRGHSV